MPPAPSSAAAALLALLFCAAVTGAERETSGPARASALRADESEAGWQEGLAAVGSRSHSRSRSPRAVPGSFLDALRASNAAAAPGLQQMSELIRLKQGAPLHTVRLPGFPSQMFRPGGMGLPGFYEGMQLGRQMLQMSLQLNEVLNGLKGLGRAGEWRSLDDDDEHYGFRPLARLSRAARQSPSPPAAPLAIP